MRFLKIFVYVTAVIALYANKASAQNDYFITHKNDSVKCTFISRYMRGDLKYKLSDDSETKIISSTEIKEYRKDGYVFVWVKLPRKSHRDYLQRILKGRINVYVETYPAGYVNVYNYFASKEPDSTLVEIRKDGFFGPLTRQKDEFTAMIADAPEVAEMFAAEDSYSIKKLLPAIRNYNLYHLSNLGFFVNNKNDTTRCNILIGEKDLLYKTPLQAGLKPLNTDSLNAYVLGKTIYYRQILPERVGAHFITQVSKGKLNVYLDLKGNIYISKAGAEFIKVKGEKETSRHKDAFFQLIADNPVVATKYKNKRYNDDNLIEMIREYNGDKPAKI